MPIPTPHMRKHSPLVGLAALLVAAFGVIAAPFPAGARAMTGAVAAASPLVVSVASDGHVTHPVWYHDTTAVQVGSNLYAAWTTNQASVEARAYDRAAQAFQGTAVTVSSATLNCNCVDSTGTNPNRHDVPTLFADPAGRVYALYGGGTASKTDGKTGPYFRAAAQPGTIAAWGPETRLDIPGAAVDLESVADNSGSVDLVGQQGDNHGGAGSLLFLRFDPGTASQPGSFEGSPPYRTLVRGGMDSQACPWLTPAGCNIYVIGRLAVGPANPSEGSAPGRLFLVWGWSEANLSNTCGNPSNFCNHGLYFAYSDDAGATWFNAAGLVGWALGSEGPIPYNDADYQVVASTTDVGLFKALVVTGAYPGSPWAIYQPGADLGHGVLKVARMTSPGVWGWHTIDSSRPWNNHVVARSTFGGGIEVWSDIAQTGNQATSIAQWTLPFPGGKWSKTTLAVGANWFLTGRPVPGGELLMWRGGAASPGRDVAFTLVKGS